MTETPDGKVVLYNCTTGERVERFPIDAKGLVESGEFSTDPTCGKAAAAAVAVAEVSDVESLSKDALIARAAAMGLTVRRHDGEDGEPLKEDYARAIRKAEKAARA